MKGRETLYVRGWGEKGGTIREEEKGGTIKEGEKGGM